MSVVAVPASITWIAAGEPFDDPEAFLEQVRDQITRVEGEARGVGNFGAVNLILTCTVDTDPEAL